MAVNLSLQTSESRETRLGSITGYHGSLKEMATQGCQGCLKNCKRDFSTGCSCSHSHCLDQLAGLEGAVIIDHSPVGCSAGLIGYNRSLNNKFYESKNADQNSNLKIFSTNIREQDTVFGASEKLRNTIQFAYDRHHPKHMYVVASCVSAIIGEDAYSIAEEMSEELGVPIGYASSEGINSKIWASGFDAYCHSVSKALLKEPKEKKDQVTYVGFYPKGRDHIEWMFERFGFKMLFLTGGSNLDDFARASESKAVFGQCGAQSSYLCGALEQRFGVKYFQSHLPYGGIGVERFLREFGAYFGKEDIAEEIIKEEKEAYAFRLAKVRKKLAGKKVFIALGASFAYEYTRMCKELGMEVIHTVAYHYDPHLDNESPDKVAAAADVYELDEDVATSVNDGQNMETMITLKHNKPDIVISRAHKASAWAVRNGITALEVRIGLPMVGYRGLVEFGELVVKTLANTNFERKFGARFRLPFTEAYLNSEPFSFLKEAQNG